MPDSWQVLGVAPGTAWPLVRARWLALSRQLHPDHHGDASAAARLADINAAYAALRRDHDLDPNGNPPTVDRGGGDGGGPVPARTATFTVSDFRPVVFEALLSAAADIGDLTDADEPFSLDLRIGGGFCHIELVPEAGGSVVTVETARVDADAVSDQLIEALVRYGRYGEQA